MRSDRKGSEEGNSESEEEAELFPRHTANNLKHAIELLADIYDPHTHASQLANCCYRCHHIQITQAYNAFRQKVHPDLPEPSISSHYTNSQFVDLRKLTRSGTEHTLNIPEPCIQPPPKTLSNILDQLFELYGYIPNLERFLLFYPTYLEKHRAVEKDLFQSGKTDSKSAYFMALCSAAQLGSVYMMARLLRRYLRSGGSTNWFTKEGFPPKLQPLRRLNRLMAREPWEITPEIIEEILDNEQLHWTRSELARYVQIMAFTHMDSTVALSMGLQPEEEAPLHEFNMLQILKLKASYDSRVYESSSEGRQKMAVMIPVLRELDDEDGEKVSEFMEQIGQGSKTIKRVEKKTETAENYMKEINNELNIQELYRQINRLVSPLLPNFQIIQKRREKNNVIDYSEYNYKFMAYPILNSLTQDTADKIEALIDYGEIMTRGNFGSEKINHTKEFRKAVRYYAENLCGYTHHEYDFKSNVGSFLTMALKFYIRLVVMSPIHISPQVIRETNHESGPIQCFDLGHLAVLLANTKMSLELTLTVQAFEL